MSGRLVTLFLLLVLNFNFITSLLSNDIKFQRILNTEAYNNGVTQDKDGIIWITTEFRGLFSYNGSKMRNITIGDHGGPVQIVSSIFVDSEGLIWFFLQGQGLCCYNKKVGSFKVHKIAEENYNTFHAIAEDRDGLIWIGTANGLSSYDKKADVFTQYRHNSGSSNSLSNNSIWTVFVARDGLIWIGTEDGLNCYDKDNSSFCCYRHDPNNPGSISDNYIQAIAEDKDGNLWVGTKSTGMDKFDKKTGTFTNYKHDSNNPNSLSHNQIHYLMVDRHNNLWICNEGNTGFDIYNIKTNTFNHYSYDPENPNSINSNNRLCAFEDSSGTVWMVDSSGGLNKCIRQKNIFKNYIHNPKDSSSISSNNIAALHEDKKGNIWIGTYRGGLCLYEKDGKFKNFNHSSDPFSLPGTSVHSILDAPDDDKLWLGVKQGFVCLFDTKTKQVVKKFQNPFFKLTPEYLTQDNNDLNVLWFACCYASGLFKLDTVTGEFTAYKHDLNDSSSVSNEVTFGILQDGAVLWIATGGNGLCRFDKTTGKCKYYKHDPRDKNSISDDIVFESFIDSRGNFWVTANGGKLNKFDRQTEKFTSYGIECGFPGKFTRHILEDSEGCLWIGTDFGIVKFDPEKLKVVNWFTIADGLTSNQFNRLPYPLKDSKGNFWFAGLGLCKFNPEEASKFESNDHIPAIILSSFKSKEGARSEDEINRSMSVTLAWPDNSFEFTFTSLDYTDPEKNQYAYKLNGVDVGWNYVGADNFGQYSNLDPGEYALCLKGSNNDGVWNEKGISIRITITPPFWMTSWFKILVGLAIFSIVGGAVHLRIRILKNKAMRDHALAEVAGQVAHDIRSPLAALRTALTQVKELSEHNRILLRTATNRIADIIHNLTVKYDTGEKSGSEMHLKGELISSLLEHLVAEKRSQMSGKSIDLVLEVNDNAHSCFADLEPGKFKRVISNLVNNAAEAIETSKGVIRVVLEKETNANIFLRTTSRQLSTSSDNSPSTINPPSLGYGEASYQQSTKTLVIKIIDNGKGIPEDILLKIQQGKKASTKKDGQGIGVSSAVKSISTWGGSYDIQSKVGKGTTFTITLPIAEEPDWFQKIIPVSPNKHIVVLDDDESIHRIWESRFREYVKNGVITLKDFYKPVAFAEYCKTLRSERDLFLVDYELLNSNETGLDLIEQLNLSQQAILVTSRYEEDDIRERIKTLGIRIIPKSFAPYIPISVENESVAIAGQPDLIQIDDDKFLTDTWELQASSVNKKIAVFNRSEDFKKVMDRYDKNIPIYIDSDLKEKVPGEIFAKFLYAQGFRTIYLATGYDKSKFDHMPWIKDIVSKEPPF